MLTTELQNMLVINTSFNKYDFLIITVNINWLNVPYGMYVYKHLISEVLSTYLAHIQTMHHSYTTQNIQCRKNNPIL